MKLVKNMNKTRKQDSLIEETMEEVKKKRENGRRTPLAPYSLDAV